MFRDIRLPVVLCLSLLLGLGSCGGGSSNGTKASGSVANGSGVGTGGTGSYTNGPISGLGSIIVNNVRYDVTSAMVISDDVDTQGHSVQHSASDLSLGMLVEVQGSGVTPVQGGPSLALATTVRFASSLLGPVSAIDNTLSTITVLGQTVHINAKTVLPASYANGDVVEVYGLSDASGQYTATRINEVSASTTPYKIAGTVTSLDSSSKLIQIGAASGPFITYGALGSLPDGVRTGARVRIWLGRTPVNGQWSATRMSVDSALVNDVDEASLEGLITQLPQNSVMLIEGSPVNVAALSGTSSLQLGQRVRVEGQLQSGVLIANELSLQTDQEVEQQEVELHGIVSSLDTQGKTFVVRGVTVDYSRTQPSGGTLANGVCVQVQGQSYNVSRQLIAGEIEVGTGCD